MTNFVQWLKGFETEYATSDKNADTVMALAYRVNMAHEVLADR